MIPVSEAGKPRARPGFRGVYRVYGLLLVAALGLGLI